MKHTIHCASNRTYTQPWTPVQASVSLFGKFEINSDRLPEGLIQSVVHKYIVYKALDRETQGFLIYKGFMTDKTLTNNNLNGNKELFGFVLTPEQTKQLFKDKISRAKTYYKLSQKADRQLNKRSVKQQLSQVVRAVQLLDN